jgi:hypothetical protein
MIAKAQDLPNMPKPDGVGIAAQNFRTAIEKLEAAQEGKGEAADDLFKAMVKAKSYVIQINGYKFERVHTGPKDSIKVVKPK